MNGVITEDRFKNMTDIQWFIHYKMIEKEETENWNIKQELMRTVLEVSVKNASVLIEDAARFITKIIAPQNYSAYLDAVKEQEAKEGKVDSELVTMENLFQSMLDSGEIEASIALDVKSVTDDMVLKTMSRRSLGIQKE